MGRLTGLSHKKASELLASYTYSLRADGRRSGVSEKRLETSGVLSQTSVSYTYDELNRLTQEASTSDDPGAVFQTSYSYDLCGNRVKKATAGAESIDYAYNDADQLLTENSSSKGQTTYGYDAGGNLISKNASAESATYAYDLEGRMVTAEIARIEQGKTVTATSNYAYNLAGTRVGAVTSGNVQGQGAFSESRKFLVDEANFTGYSQVLEEFGSTGALSRSYVIGDDILSQNRGNGSETLLADGHGSTRLLTHSSGTVMERYSFDAYGVMLGGNKGISNRAGTNYLYSGEEYDDSLQMQYLRARYYDQNTGSFNALDPYAGNMQEPQSYNKYGYCHSDPVNGCDPSGMENIMSVMGALTVMSMFMGGYLRLTHAIGTRIEELLGSNELLNGVNMLLGMAIVTSDVVSLVLGVAFLASAAYSLYKFFSKTFGSGRFWKMTDAYRKAFNLPMLGSNTTAPRDGMDTMAIIKHESMIFGTPNINGTSGIHKVNTRDWLNSMAGQMKSQGLLTAQGADQIVKHAESSTLLQMWGLLQGKMPKDIVMYCDRQTCDMCMNNLQYVMRFIGVDNLTVHYKGPDGALITNTFKAY